MPLCCVSSFVYMFHSQCVPVFLLHDQYTWGAGGKQQPKFLVPINNEKRNSGLLLV